MGLFDLGSAPNTSAIDTSSPFIQAAQANAYGNLKGAQAATSANRLNQNTAYGGLNYQQTGTDQYGNPTYSVNQTLAPEFQGAFNNLAQNVQNASQTPLDTGMASWDKATGLINERLQPQIQRENEASDAQLANQGIMPGSQAYNTAKTLLSQQHNDLSNQAQLAGLSAQNQFFNQGVTSSNLPLAQLGAFKSATTPTYVSPYQQQGVAGPDYLTAYGLQNQNNIAMQNMDTNQRNAILTGLGGVGQSLIAGGTGDNSALSGLYNLGMKGYNALPTSSGISGWLQGLA
jgi:hypothetical protein